MSYRGSKYSRFGTQTLTVEACRRSKWRPECSNWCPGGSIDQWSQIPITLMRSRILIRIRTKVKSWIRIRNLLDRHIFGLCICLYGNPRRVRRGCVDKITKSNWIRDVRHDRFVKNCSKIIISDQNRGSGTGSRVLYKRIRILVRIRLWIRSYSRVFHEVCEIFSDYWIIFNYLKLLKSQCSSRKKYEKREHVWRVKKFLVV